MDVLIAGGGMITEDQVLPSFYQLQRAGIVGEISVCARRESTLAALHDSARLREAFPGQSFRAVAASYEHAIPALAPRNLVFMALPDQTHFDAVMTALRHDQHVIAVKPLVLRVEDSVRIEEEARRRGLFVGIEYHKRFDDRSLMARRRYRAGSFGDFRLGTACLMEKWYYRHSNFQNWFTAENSDAFTYIGCHYVDLVHFITGLLPAAVSVYGLRDKLPNGREGFLWTDARVIWNNGACLNVQNSLSFPDAGPGTNTQGMTLYCAQGDRGGMLSHSDQYRGIAYAYVDQPTAAGATMYTEPSADYFQYLDLGGPGLTAVGYGYRSIEALLRGAMRVEAASDHERELRAIDDQGLIATPANSRYNEAVIEAARRSILNNGELVEVSAHQHPYGKAQTRQ